MTWQESSFSRMGAQLTGSAIRQMGILAAGRPDLISFAPGYPDPAMFAWLLSTSMLCARVVRGTISMLKVVILFAAHCGMRW